MLIRHDTCHRGMWIMCYVKNGWKLVFEWIIAYPYAFLKSDLSTISNPERPT
jgi:hypothetical protein